VLKEYRAIVERMPGIGSLLPADGEGETGKRYNVWVLTI